MVIFGVPYTPDYYTSTPLSMALTIIFSIFPWNLLMKGFTDLGSANVNDDYPGEHHVTTAHSVQSAHAMRGSWNHTGWQRHDESHLAACAL